MLFCMLQMVGCTHKHQKKRHHNKQTRLIPQIVRYSTCLENNLLATNTCSLQINEGSHLLGPWVLGNETMTGLKESVGIQRDKERNNKKRYKLNKMTPILLTGQFNIPPNVLFTCSTFSSAPLNRKMTPWLRGVDWLAREWRTSSITAQLTASSLAPKTEKLSQTESSVSRIPIVGFQFTKTLVRATEISLNLLFTFREMQLTSICPYLAK